MCHSHRTIRQLGFPVFSAIPEIATSKKNVIRDDSSNINVHFGDNETSRNRRLRLFNCPGKHFNSLQNKLSLVEQTLKVHRGKIVTNPGMWL